MFKFINTVRGTQMEIYLGSFNIEIEIVGYVSRRIRRAMLLAIFHRINPLFELIETGETEFKKGSIAHRDGLEENRFRDLDRPIKLQQALKTETAIEQRGFEIRMLRLKKGHSQKKLAEALGLNRGNLSEIEKGHHSAKQETLDRIQTYLEAQTDKPTFDSAKDGAGGKVMNGWRFDRLFELPPEILT